MCIRDSLSTNRKNSMGANLANDNDLRTLAEQVNACLLYTSRCV